MTAIMLLGPVKANGVAGPTAASTGRPTAQMVLRSRFDLPAFDTFACMSNAANDMNAMEPMAPAGRLLAEGDELITLAEAARRLPLPHDCPPVTIAGLSTLIIAGCRGLAIASSTVSTNCATA